MEKLNRPKLKANHLQLNDIAMTLGEDREFRNQFVKDPSAFLEKYGLEIEETGVVCNQPTAEICTPIVCVAVVIVAVGVGVVYAAVAATAFGVYAQVATSTQAFFSGVAGNLTEPSPGFSENNNFVL